MDGSTIQFRRGISSTPAPLENSVVGSSTCTEILDEFAREKGERVLDVASTGAGKTAIARDVDGHQRCGPGIQPGRVAGVAPSAGRGGRKRGRGLLARERASTAELLLRCRNLNERATPWIATSTSVCGR